MINSSEQNSLHDACLKGHIDAVKLLIAKGADVNFEDHNKLTPLHIACFSDHKNIADLLIKNQANINIDITEKPIVESPLHLASLKNHHEIVRLLLENGADIDAIDKNGKTPLNYAMSANSTETIEELIKRGANPDVKDEYGNLPSHYLEHLAQRNFSEERFINFLGGDLNSNIQNRYNQTPLHYSARNNSLDTLKFLLEKGDNVEAKDKFGATALFYAINNNRYEAVVLLLKNGADLQTSEEYKKIPSEINYIPNPDLKTLLDKTRQADLLLNISLRNVNIDLFKGAMVSLESIGLMNRISNIKKDNLFLMIEGGAEASQKIETLKLLKQNGFDIYQKNSKGDNILSLALKKGDGDLIEQIFKQENGLDLERLSKDAKPKILSVVQKPTSCFSCLSVGNILKITFSETRSPSSVKVKLSQEVSGTLQRAFEQGPLVTADIGHVMRS